MLYLAFTARFAYKVFPLKTQTTEVTLPPPLPPGVKSNLVPSKKPPAKPGPGPATQLTGSQGSAGAGQVQRRKSLATPPGIPSGTPAEARQGFEPAFPELSSQFDLVPPSETKINITPYSLLKEGKFIQSGKYKAPRELSQADLAKYAFWGISGVRGGGTAKQGVVGGTSGTGQRGSATFNIQGYDISPWATEALNKIQKNWNIPSLQTANPAGKVGISVIIEKSGEISQLEITLSSLDQWLDQAAVDALKLSAPFSRLPADFPKSNLEAYFLFEYGE